MLARAAAAVLAVCAVSVPSAWADAQQDLHAAIQKLADSPNYSWTTKLQGVFGGAPMDGKSEKNGYTTYTINTMGGSYPVISRGDRTFAKTDNGWQGMAELQKASDDAQGFSSEGFVLVQVQDFKTPVAQLTDLAGKLQNLKKTDQGFSADILPDAAKNLFTFRLPGQPATQKAALDQSDKVQTVVLQSTAMQQMTVKDPRGTLNVVMKDGSISKFEIHLAGTISLNEKDQPTDRTTITEIKDVGTTRITVPEDAKAILDQRPTGGGR